MQAEHDAGAVIQLEQNDSSTQVADCTADDAEYLDLPPVNPAPSIPASSADRLSLLSPLNAAPSVSLDAYRSSVPSIEATTLPSAPAAPTAPAVAQRDGSRDAEAGSKQGIVPHRAHSNRIRASTATQQGGSPTIHTLRLPDMTSNVTMATKDAFACVNAMFSSSLSHEPCHTSKPAALVEPTVTISTKAAFAELNQMFSSDLPHRKQRVDNRQQSGLPRPAVRRTIGKRLPLDRPCDSRDDMKGTVTAVAVGPAQPSSAALQPAEATGTLGMYEDTCLLDSPKPEAHKDDPCGYAVYEDTKFFGDQAGPPQLARSPAANQAAGDFQIYEDTQCIQGKSRLQANTDASQDAALSLYEDTQFVNKGVKVAAALVTSPAGFGVYEDTEFIRKPDCTDAKCHHPDEDLGGLGMHEDTQFVHKPSRSVAAVTSSPGDLGIYEDTQLVASSDARRTNLKVPSSVPAAKPEEVEDKENRRWPARYHLLLTVTIDNLLHIFIKHCISTPLKPVTPCLPLAYLCCDLS